MTKQQETSEGRLRQKKIRSRDRKTGNIEIKIFLKLCRTSIMVFICYSNCSDNIVCEFSCTLVMREWCQGGLTDVCSLLRFSPQERTGSGRCTESRHLLYSCSGLQWLTMVRQPDLSCLGGQRYCRGGILWTVKLKFGRQLTEDCLPYWHPVVKFIKKLRPILGNQNGEISRYHRNVKICHRWNTSSR